MWSFTMVSEAAFMSALVTVIDPHLNISVVEMRMIRAVKVSTNGSVSVEMVFPCIGCPAWSMMQNDIRDAVSEVPGVTSASVKVVWDEPWKKSEDRKNTRLNSSH